MPTGPPKARRAVVAKRNSLPRADEARKPDRFSAAYFVAGGGLSTEIFLVSAAPYGKDGQRPGGWQAFQPGDRIALEPEATRRLDENVGNAVMRDDFPGLGLVASRKQAIVVAANTLQVRRRRNTTVPPALQQDVPPGHGAIHPRTLLKQACGHLLVGRCQEGVGRDRRVQVIQARGPLAVERDRCLPPIEDDQSRVRATPRRPTADMAMNVQSTIFRPGSHAARRSHLIPR